jgi:hypothetical protein
MITEEHQKEYLSLSYISAIAAKAGFTCDKPSLDYGVDLSISNVERFGHGVRETGHKIELQVKCTWDFREIDQMIHYNLEIKNYKDLIVPDRKNPILLVVYCLPRDIDQWISYSTPTNFTDNKTEFKYGPIWKSFRGSPGTTNSTTIAVQIPKANSFNHNSLSNLMLNYVNGILPV